MDGRRLAGCARARQPCIKRPCRAARRTTRTTGTVDATFDLSTAIFTSGMSQTLVTAASAPASPRTVHVAGTGPAVRQPTAGQSVLCLAGAARRASQHVQLQAGRGDAQCLGLRQLQQRVAVLVRRACGWKVEEGVGHFGKAMHARRCDASLGSPPHPLFTRRRRRIISTRGPYKHRAATVNHTDTQCKHTHTHRV